MPCIPVTLKALKPKESDFEPHTLGEHIRKRRLELGLTQKEAAGTLGVNSWTVLNWENDNTKPPIDDMPGILAFLGYDPFPEPSNLREQLVALRRKMGWTIKEAAERLGVDEGTWGEWARTGSIPWQRHREIAAAFIQAVVGRGIDP